VPEVPYAWQEPNEPLLLPSGKTSRINVLGFLSRQNDFSPYVFECPVNSDIVAACFDDFSLTIKKITIVIIDNASIHHSQTFQDESEKWEKRGLFLYYLPKYSPELNLIEILWKHIKYYWLPISAYKGFDSLRKELNKVLMDIGKSHSITFS
jgi:transposase